MVVYSAMDGPACKGDQMWQHTGSKGDQMWQYLMQWIIQLSKVARRTKCGSIQYNALSSYYTWVARRTKGVAVFNAMDCPAIMKQLRGTKCGSVDDSSLKLASYNAI